MHKILQGLNKSERNSNEKRIIFPHQTIQFKSIPFNIELFEVLRNTYTLIEWNPFTIILRLNVTHTLTESVFGMSIIQRYLRLQSNATRWTVRQAFRQTTSISNASFSIDCCTHPQLSGNLNEMHTIKLQLLNFGNW